MNNITIIGTGNVATVLGKLFIQNNYCIKQIIGRREGVAKELSDALECPYSLRLEAMNQDSDLYVIAVSDKAVTQVADEIIIPKESIVVHTAGGVSINVFKDKFAHYGVLYPLQSLRKENKIIPAIPFFVDANNNDARNKLLQFAKTASSLAHFADDKQRLQLHLAAVFTNNFPNFLYTLAYDFCSRQQMDFSNLIPLMEVTVHRLKYFNPAEMQTGPAIRKDEATMEKHLQLLKNDMTAHNIYRFLSDEIMKYFQ